MKILKELVAVCSITIAGLTKRLGNSLASVFSIALVVMVLLGFLAIADGFEKTVGTGGSENVALVLSENSPSEMMSALPNNAEMLMRDAPAIVRIDGTPAVSAETVATVSAPIAGDQERGSLSLRGIGQMGLAVRPMVSLIEGSAPTPGTNEILVGAALQRDYPAFEVGRAVRLGSVDWQVVGVFSAGQSALESEAFADVNIVRSVFSNQAATQSIRALVRDPSDITSLGEYADRHVSAPVSVRSEAEVMAAQAEGSSKIIRYIGWPLTIIMAIGALAGAINTMYASVDARRKEIATLRLLGFSGTSIFASTLAESIVLALVGGAFGIVASLVMFDGLQGSTMAGNLSQVSFELDVNVQAALAALTVATLVGLIGSLIPATKAIRQSLIDALATE